MRSKVLKIGLGLCLILASSMVFSQSTSSIRIDDVKASEIFRRAVVRFHASYHSEAISLFQQVLALQPGNDLARTWLARSYYYAGFENAALQEWEILEKKGQASPALVSFREQVESRLGPSKDLREDFQFFPVHELTRDTAGGYGYRRPAGLVCLSDGTSFVASFATNSIIRFDAQGRANYSWNGGRLNLGGPFALVLVQGKRIFCTEMVSDSVVELDLSGNVVKRFGTSGIGDGQFKGPQFISWDGDNALYVSDFGNRRIQKFDLEGNFIQSIGEKSESFEGLVRPTGLLWFKGILIAGDASRTNPRLLMFDASGNLIDQIADPELADVEDIEAFEGDQILVTCRKKIFSMDINQRALNLEREAEKTDGRFVASAIDPNGNLVVSDFDNEKIQTLSRLAGIYSGLHVQINHINSDNFPQLVVNLSIEDNLGKPVIGLDANNFSLTEERKALANVKLLSVGYRENKIDGVVLFQADGKGKNQGMLDDFGREAVGNAVRGIYKSLGASARLVLVSAGEQASNETKLGDSEKTSLDAVDAVPASDFWYLDQGLRLAAPQIMAGNALRHIFLVVRGALPEDAFKRYGFEENLAYLRNNRIRLDVIQVDDGPLDVSLQRLVTETGGTSYHLYDAKGLTTLADDILPKKDASYILSCDSLFDSDFGRQYLPIEVEARLFQKSGRDESGYFAPLKL